MVFKTLFLVPFIFSTAAFSQDYKSPVISSDIVIQGKIMGNAPLKIAFETTYQATRDNLFCRDANIEEDLSVNFPLKTISVIEEVELVGDNFEIKIPDWSKEFCQYKVMFEFTILRYSSEGMTMFGQDFWAIIPIAQNSTDPTDQQDFFITISG